MDDRLTRDSERLLCALYKRYLEDRKNGIGKGEARHMGGSKWIHTELVPKWSFEDVDETCRELDRAGMLSVLYADDEACEVALSDSCIVYMENRFKDGLKGVVSFLAQFIP